MVYGIIAGVDNGLLSTGQTFIMMHGWIIQQQSV